MIVGRSLVTARIVAAMISRTSSAALNLRADGVSLQVTSENELSPNVILSLTEKLQNDYALPLIAPSATKAARSSFTNVTRASACAAVVNPYGEEFVADVVATAA